MNLLGDAGSNDGSEKVVGSTGSALAQPPLLIPVQPAENDSEADTANLLRLFHLGEPAASAEIPQPGSDCLPALLNSYRGVREFRYDYPLLVGPVDEENLDIRPLSQYLEKAVESFAPDDASARILKDNLDTLEGLIRQEIAAEPVPASDVVVKAGTALQKQIALGPDNAVVLQADLDRLRERIPEGSRLVGYAPDVAIRLLADLIRHRSVRRHRQFREKLDAAIGGLERLISVEKGKAGDEAVGDKLAGTSNFFDPNNLSKVLRQRSQGVLSMAPDRLARIQETLITLRANRAFTQSPTLVTRSGMSIGAGIVGFRFVECRDPCAQAMVLYDEQAADLAKLFAALRIAELDIVDRYDHQFHDSWFQMFDQEAFSDEETRLLPAVVVLDSAEHLGMEQMQSFSRSLASSKPLHILVMTQAHGNPGQPHEDDPLHGQRLELAYLGIGHRRVMVNQVSVARHESLLQGFLTALDGNHTSLHLLHTGIGQDQPIHPWLVSGAALESRAHPFLRFDPSLSERDQESVTFGDNPDPNLDWTSHVLTCRNEDNELEELEMAFTFADYCLLKPDLRHHYRIVPEGFDCEDLVPVAEHLDADDDRLIPFIWAVDGHDTLRKLVISRMLLLACRDRQRFWRTLQSVAGLRNYYVEEAIEKVRRQEQETARTELAGVQAEQLEELERVRVESAEDVIRQLTQVLLGLNLTGDVLPAAAPLPDADAEPADQPAEMIEENVEPDPIAQEVDEAEEDISFDEPFIDSYLCTTCDDCMAVNKLVFVYNDNKQAIFGDASAGTYEQMVRAAELCPAKCIHPGKPLNPDEPGLDELIQRAEPYN